MAIATITIEDQTDGDINVSADFGDALDKASPAHNVAAELLNAVLGQAKRVETLEDTTGDEAITRDEPRIQLLG